MIKYEYFSFPTQPLVIKYVPVQDPFVFIGTFTKELEVPSSTSELWLNLESLSLENRNRKLCLSQFPIHSSFKTMKLGKRGVLFWKCI